MELVAWCIALRTNVMGFSKIAAKALGVAWVTTLIPVRTGGFA
jgi:uncharacterized membrane protein YtjA (UPF0391 family)